MICCALSNAQQFKIGTIHLAKQIDCNSILLINLCLYNNHMIGMCWELRLQSCKLMAIHLLNTMAMLNVLHSPTSILKWSFICRCPCSSLTSTNVYSNDSTFGVHSIWCHLFSALYLHEVAYFDHTQRLAYLQRLCKSVADCNIILQSTNPRLRCGFGSIKSQIT